MTASLARTTLFVSLTMICMPALAEDSGGKLLLTGGVSQLEGAAGGGLTPWAVIGGYGTSDQIGANAFYTRVNVGDYHLDDAGVLIGIYDRVELSYAQQRFDTEQVGAALGLGEGFTFKQDIYRRESAPGRRCRARFRQPHAADLRGPAVQEEQPGRGARLHRRQGRFRHRLST